MAAIIRRMTTKRLLAGALWFLTGWYAGGFIAFVTGTDGSLSLILGVVAAALVVADPRRIIWSARDRATSSTLEAAPEAA